MIGHLLWIGITVWALVVWLLGGGLLAANLGYLLSVLVMVGLMAGLPGTLWLWWKTRGDPGE